MKQIIKRLEIIKSSIAIDDEEIIELQIIKLKELDADSGIKNILKTTLTPKKTTRTHHPTSMCVYGKNTLLNCSFFSSKNLIRFA